MTLLIGHVSSQAIDPNLKLSDLEVKSALNMCY